MKRLTAEFERYCKSAQVPLILKQGKKQSKNDEHMMIYLLSVFAELMRENPRLSLPVSRKFIEGVLQIDR